jgi:Zn-dependent protease with chaperone function
VNLAAVVAVVILVVAALAAVGWVTLQGRLALRDAGARPLVPGRSPRLVSLVRGLSEDVGVEMPSLWTFDSGRINAFVCHSIGPCVAVSDGALDTFSRTELEAIVAHCLARVQRRQARAQQFAIAMGRPADAARHIEEDDVAAANLTRYPPALAAALRKSDPVGGRFSALYFAGEGPEMPSVEQRAEALLDL